MPRESLERLREALARLPTASRADLRAEWLRLYRTEAPARLGRELLIAAIAYRLQEEALGGVYPIASPQSPANRGEFRIPSAEIRNHVKSVT